MPSDNDYEEFTENLYTLRNPILARLRERVTLVDNDLIMNAIDFDWVQNQSSTGETAVYLLRPSYTIDPPTTAQASANNVAGFFIQSWSVVVHSFNPSDTVANTDAQDEVGRIGAQVVFALANWTPRFITGDALSLSTPIEPPSDPKPGWSGDIFTFQAVLALCLPESITKTSNLTGGQKNG